MDVDKDVDGLLAQQFGCMGTVDRETLIRQFQQILGPYVNLTTESCHFFLDMNNWFCKERTVFEKIKTLTFGRPKHVHIVDAAFRPSERKPKDIAQEVAENQIITNLQAAVGSYYDYNAHDLMRLPNMVFVKDVTIGEGESIPPNTKFLKIWRLQNVGDDAWPDGCLLKHIAGEIQAATDSVFVKSLQACEFVDVSVEMTSPISKGIYQSRWQMNTPNGIPFGETIWCIIVVEENGLLSLTQRLAATHCTEEQLSCLDTKHVSNVFRTATVSNVADNLTAPPCSSNSVENVGICSSIFNARTLDASINAIPPFDPFHRCHHSERFALENFPNSFSADGNNSVPSVPPCTPDGLDNCSTNERHCIVEIPEHILRSDYANKDLNMDDQQ